jgi:hypothetical protein
MEETLYHSNIQQLPSEFGAPILSDDRKVELSTQQQLHEILLVDAPHGQQLVVLEVEAV